MAAPERDPLAAAHALVAAEFPTATAAFLGRSVLSSLRNATSDLDILVVQNQTTAPTLQRVRRYGWPVELFVHTPQSLRGHWARDVKVRRQALLRVAAEGVSLLADSRQFEQLQAEAKHLVRVGPSPIDPADLEQRRFVISDLIDDLDGCVVPSEMTYIANALLLQVANVVLMTAGHWTGSSKWLGRELADHDPELAAQLYEAHRRAVADADGTELSRVSRRILEGLGGPFPPEFFDRS